MHDRNHCCAQMMYTYTRTAYTRRGGAAEMRHAPCSIVPHEFYARLPVTDHRYAPGVTKTKGIHAQTPLRVEIQTEVGGKKERLFFQNLPLRYFFRFVFSFFFPTFLSFFFCFLIMFYPVITDTFLTNYPCSRTRAVRMTPVPSIFPLRRIDKVSG